MQIRKAASVLPEPVGAEISVVFPARMCGQPCCWGSVGVPKRLTNQSRTSGWAHSRPEASGGTNSVSISLRPNYSAVVRNSQTKLAAALGVARSQCQEISPQSAKRLQQPLFAPSDRKLLM